MKSTKNKQQANYFNNELTLIEAENLLIKLTI